MRAFEMFFGGVFGLVLVYLLVKNAKGVNSVFQAFSQFNTSLITSLQGNGSAFAGTVNLNI